MSIPSTRVRCVPNRLNSWPPILIPQTGRWWHGCSGFNRLTYGLNFSPRFLSYPMGHLGRPLERHRGWFWKRVRDTILQSLQNRSNIMSAFYSQTRCILIRKERLNVCRARWKTAQDLNAWMFKECRKFITGAENWDCKLFFCEPLGKSALCVGIRSVNFIQHQTESFAFSS